MPVVMTEFRSINIFLQNYCFFSRIIIDTIASLFLSFLLLFYSSFISHYFFPLPQSKGKGNQGRGSAQHICYGCGGELWTAIISVRLHGFSSIIWRCTTLSNAAQCNASYLILFILVFSWYYSFALFHHILIFFSYFYFFSCKARGDLYHSMTG